jgi:alanine racemase
MKKQTRGRKIETARQTWAEIDLDALASNYHAIRRIVGDKTEVICVVKADAYGHGAVLCARRLAREGASWFAVACLEEAFELRANGIDQSILSFGGFGAGQEAWLIRERVTPVICRLEAAKRLNEAARAAGVVFDVHVEIDTGMNRSGVRVEDADEFAEKLRALENLRVEGLMTHFAAADDPTQNDFARKQIKLYKLAEDRFRARGHHPTLLGLANSPALYAFPSARGNAVRPGGVLYGLWRDVLPPQNVEPALRPVLHLRARIVLLKTIRAGESVGYSRTFVARRDTKVATLAIGYHDGVPRALSNRGRVIVHGQFAPIIGRISMDLTTIDVTDVAQAVEGDVVTLIGADGDLQITAEEVARQANTISYEITCGIGRRVPRMACETNLYGASDEEMQN